MRSSRPAGAATRMGKGLPFRLAFWAAAVHRKLLDAARIAGTAMTAGRPHDMSNMRETNGGTRTLSESIMPPKVDNAIPRKARTCSQHLAAHGLYDPDGPGGRKPTAQTLQRAWLRAAA